MQSVWKRVVRIVTLLVEVMQCLRSATMSARILTASLILFRDLCDLEWVDGWSFHEIIEICPLSHLRTTRIFLPNSLLSFYTTCVCLPLKLQRLRLLRLPWLVLTFEISPYTSTSSSTINYERSSGKRQSEQSSLNKKSSCRFLSLIEYWLTLHNYSVFFELNVCTTRDTFSSLFYSYGKGGKAQKRSGILFKNALDRNTVKNSMPPISVTPAFGESFFFLFSSRKTRSI